MRVMESMSKNAHGRLKAGLLRAKDEKEFKETLSYFYAIDLNGFFLHIDRLFPRSQPKYRALLIDLTMELIEEGVRVEFNSHWEKIRRCKSHLDINNCKINKMEKSDKKSINQAVDSLFEIWDTTRKSLRKILEDPKIIEKIKNELASDKISPQDRERFYLKLHEYAYPKFSDLTINIKGIDCSLSQDETTKCIKNNNKK